MQFSITKCPVCKGKGESERKPRPERDGAGDITYEPAVRCVACVGTGAVPYFEVLLEQILAELKLLNSRKK